MSMTEILQELPRLDSVQRQEILRQLVALDAGLELDETPEMLAAIDRGVESLQSSPPVSLAEARAKLREWTSR